MNVSAQPPRKWTVLMWSACDNNLYECCVNDLDKSEEGTNDSVHVLATVDHRPSGGGAQRLELQKDGLPLLHSPVKADHGDFDTANPKNLADFIEWGIKNYPAENYWLVISDHGDAWKGAAQDEGHHTWMSLPQIESGLKEARERTGRKLDMLSFDCCHMASTEVAHQLQNESRYLVASEEVMGYIGLPYQEILKDAAGLSPHQLAQHLVHTSKANPEDIPTFSAVDLEKMPSVTKAVTALGQAITQSPLTGQELRGVLQDTQAFWEYRDLKHLATNLGQQPDANLAQAAVDVQVALSEAIVAEQHAASHPNAGGLQIEVHPDSEEARQARYREEALDRNDPRPWKTTEGSYAETSFARETGWTEAIAKINS